MLEINEYFYRLAGKDMYVHKNHTHNEIEIIQVISGSGTLLKNNKTYLLQSQSVFVIDGRVAHIVYPKPEDCSNYVRNKIVIQADSLLKFSETVGLDTVLKELILLPPTSTAQLPEIDELFKKIHLACSEKTKNGLSIAHGYIIELIHLIHKNSNDSDSQDGRSVLSRILEMIAESDNVISLEKISKTLHFNKCYISHMFKEKTGMSLSDYISEKTYEKGCRLLSGTSYSVEDIGRICGFSSSAAFSRFFKHKNGLSPMNFRKNLQTRNTNK